MTANATACALLLALTLAPQLAGAETFRVDDTGTIASTPVTPMRWRQLIPGRAADHTAEGTLQVDLRLNLARWQGKPLRMFLVFTPTPDGKLRADWRSQGRLLSGSVLSGGRTLVYEGLGTAAPLQETLQMQLTGDGRQMSRAQQLQFYFEVEVVQ